MRNTKTQKVNTVLVILYITIFLTASIIYGQNKMDISRAYLPSDKDSVLSRYPSYTLELNGVSIGILSDSIGIDLVHTVIYAIYPKDTDLSNTFIKIKFADGSEHYFLPSNVQTDGYVEYELTNKSYFKLFTSNVDSLALNGSTKYTKVDDSDYFYYFLNNYSK